MWSKMDFRFTGIDERMVSQIDVAVNKLLWCRKELWIPASDYLNPWKIRMMIMINCV